ncbi:MAG TPA: hypothetical protein PLK30_25665 [Blastocatellia bacterium]|nr:hypothetical protein [Blastocatellia bacterium]
MDEKLQRAFQLAYFILGDEQAALRVTREAVASLDVALAAQDKRLYYAPGSRAAQPKARAFANSHFRTKVNLSELQMLQRLVYIAAEPEERHKETEGIPQATWLVHYLKHLARITLKRNSFFVTLGISRLLHNYTTPETMQIYGLVVQDPARVRDDSYYRRRKAQLMRELKERFAEQLIVQRGLRGEERFYSLEEAHPYLQLVCDCLQTFTPWETNCSVPAAFDPQQDELPPLHFRGIDPDAEHTVETARFHTILHPDCFRRLLSALGLDVPTKRLELPQFYPPSSDPPSANNGNPPNQGRPPAALSEEEMQRIKEYVAQQRELRKRFSPTWLRVMVDGAVRGHTTPNEPSQLRFAIAPDAELIEVYGVSDAEKLRLAAYLLSYDEEGNLLPTTATLILEDGQQLSFTVHPQSDAAGLCTGAQVAITYRETAPLRAALWWLRRQRQRIFQAAPSESPSTLWKPALAFTLLVMLSATLFYWFFVKRVAPQNELAHNTTPTPSVSPSVAPTQPSMATSPTPHPSAPPPLNGDEVIAMDIRTRTSDDPTETLTRSERTEAVGLLQAKKVYVEISGAEKLRQTNSEQITRRLQADGKFRLVGSQDEADIALKMTLVATQQDRLVLTAGLVDTHGNVIWPLTPGASRRRYEGPTEKTIALFSRELANDIKRLERKQK